MLGVGVVAMATIRVLIVDDEDDYRRTLVKTLGRRGFVVLEAAGGMEALQIVREEEVHVLVLDLKMPVMDGLQTLRALNEVRPDLPVVILTGHGTVRSGLDAVAARAVDFLQKPVDVDHLALVIREAVASGPRKGSGA